MIKIQIGISLGQFVVTNSPIIAKIVTKFPNTKITRIERHHYKIEKATVAARKLVAKAKKLR